MTDLNNLISPFYLKDKEIRKIIEIIFFSYRDFTEGPDRVLEKLNFGRAHHRVIYFVGKKKNITIKNLLRVLKITKQSLSRVLNQLVKEGYITVSTGLDKRTKTLLLTDNGYNLEKKLSSIQTNKIKTTLGNFNEDAINSFKKILFEMIETDNKRIFQQLNE
ncbi:MAG: MarR family transcriptional regulator [Pelagibacteraceae bacterium]|jgi:DNA-binding MarR family transcriptional regulator|nr:MarR family transcriptional regulator [Pelagibacteraceae bacterium]MBT3901887.1 MarR family transcriptional regulator [Pelagibacteraceae bacterium]MBT4645853.1 MarR family transcriptional regulator [Pelagibacteraceae bacterium]MBT4950320.1 MarR family transcriptional regulator [Pelagibacteraceae bacterium]MBT5213706.1 MarR family transcriptional regulator [Pelagibacteraceae bacterium]